MSGAFVIRRLHAADAALYRAIRLEALEHDPIAFGSTLEAEAGQPLAFFADRLEGSFVFGALRGTEAVGTAGIYFDPASMGAGTLWTVYVRAGQRRHGLGERLVEAAIASVSTRTDRIHLKVNSENPAATRLYARLGFAKIGIEKNTLERGGRFYDEIVMEKRL